MADADVLPTYNTLFPEELPNTVVNGRRRWLSLPPEAAQAAEEVGQVETRSREAIKHFRTRSVAQLFMARPCSTDRHRTDVKSEQCKLVPVEQEQYYHEHKQQRPTESAAISTKGFNNTFRRLENLKDSSVGVVCTENFNYGVSTLTIGKMSTEGSTSVISTST